MTEQEQKDAHSLIVFLGGMTAVLLLPSLRRRHNVEFDHGRFFIAGRMVSAAEIRTLLEQLRFRVAARLSRLTEDLHNGILTMEQWADETIRLIDAAHNVAAALGAGSLVEVTLFPSVREQVEKERSYFTGFLGQMTAAAAVGSIIVGLDARRAIVRGELATSRFTAAGSRAVPSSHPLSPNRVRARAASYVRAIRVTYAGVELDVMTALGRTEAKRHRTAAESCRGCIRYAGRWLPIDQMPRIGSLDCGGYCLCYLTYR